jgi:ABC-2 type transport system permease protein
LRSPETITAHRAPLRPLLAKEIREIVAGRALWILLLLMCPLIGYSFFQAVSLYSESSIAAQQSPVHRMSRSLSCFRSSRSACLVRKRNRGHYGC